MAYGKHNQSGIIFVISLILNLFTALLAVPSLEKRPIEVPDLKSLRFLPSSQEHVKGLLPECTGIESRVVIGAPNMLFAGVCVCTFQSGNFTSWGS